MTFGTSVTAYNKKAGVKRDPRLFPGEVMTAPKTPIPKFDPSKGSLTSQIQGLQPPHPIGNGASNTPAGGSAKSAVSGGTSFSASGIIGQGAINTFQPMYSGIKPNAGNTGLYNRLGAINATGDIANEGMNAQVAARNALIKRKQAMMQSQSSIGDFSGYNGGNPTEGAEFFGIGDGSGSGLDQEQLSYAREIANVGRQRGMGDNAIRIALMTALTESGLRNLNHGDRDSLGLFQQRTSQGWGSTSQILNPTYSAGKFYDTLKGVGGWQSMSPWQAAQKVQRSFDPSGSNYQRQWQLANRGFNSLSSTPAKNYGGAPNSAQGFISAYNNKYVDYDGAYGAQCVDLYNAYTARFVGGQNIMVGWAPELFTHYDTKAYTRLGAGGYGHMGDVAVFNRGGATPSGHVAIVVGDNGNGTLRVLQANATSAGPAGNTIISNISKASLMGYLRPNKLMGR